MASRRHPPPTSLTPQQGRSPRPADSPNAVPATPRAANPQPLALLDLLAELIATDIWRQARRPSQGPEDDVPNPNPVSCPHGSSTPMAQDPRIPVRFPQSQQIPTHIPARIPRTLG